MRVLFDGLHFPEAPRWRDGWLYFSDFHGHKVRRLALDGRVELVAEVEKQPSGLGFTPEGDLLIVSMLDHRVLRKTGERLETYAEIGAFCGGNANDLVVNTDGRAYVGNFGFQFGQPHKTTNLIRVDPDGSASVAAADMMFPNGMVITPDGKRLIVAETFASRLTAFDIRPDGTLANRAVFADLGTILPDGICLDAEGAIWVAHMQSATMVRVFEGGRISDRITVEKPGPAACMLGGPDGKTLFLCTNDFAKLGPSRPTNGRIEAVEVSVPRAGLP